MNIHRSLAMMDNKAIMSFTSVAADCWSFASQGSTSPYLGQCLAYFYVMLCSSYMKGEGLLPIGNDVAFGHCKPLLHLLSDKHPRIHTKFCAGKSKEARVYI